MEAAIRWSPHATEQSSRFLIVDVAKSRLRLFSIDSIEDDIVNYKQLAQRDHLPNYSAFDWSKTDPNYVAIGSTSGDAILLQIDPDNLHTDFMQSYPIKLQRKCNSIAFSSKNLLATGLDRVRTDFCMNIYDLNSRAPSANQEPLRKLASSEAITSIKFFDDQPDTLVAGVARQCIRLYDIRSPDSASANISQYTTRQVHNVAIDPLDQNYFISAGPPGDPIVSVWDRRHLGRSSPGTPSEGYQIGSVLELRPAVDNSQNASIWSLRFCGTKRGCFGMLSNTGEIKMVELARHSTQPALRAVPTNESGGTGWDSRHYTRFTHQVRQPWYVDDINRDEKNRVIACDFMATGNLRNEPSMISLYPSREVKAIRLPSKPPRVRFTTMNELYSDFSIIARPSPSNSTIAGDLGNLQDVVTRLKPKSHSSSHSRSQLTGRLERKATENSGHRAPSPELSSSQAKSQENHEGLLSLGYPLVKLSIEDTLTVLDKYKRRCREGYGLDCQKNKEIISNDPWLVELWDLIQRFDVLARDDGMVAHTIDLSYFGIVGIWSCTFTTRDVNRSLNEAYINEEAMLAAVKEINEAKGFPQYQGVKTGYPELRRLCLAICNFNQGKHRLWERCMYLMDAKEYYKSIVLAVFMGYKDLALDLLKYAIQHKYLHNVGLGAVIACDQVNEDQRGVCSWMADETDDPYLKALLSYFITGDWEIVTKMDDLALADRIGVAMKHLEDERLGEFLQLAMSKTIIYGNVEGIILTGLSARAVDLFEHYISKFGDLQTAVLALARAVPRFVFDARFVDWRDLYFQQMQTWRAFLERTRFISQHNKMSADRSGYNPFTEEEAFTPPSPQVTIRCSRCQMSLALRGGKLVTATHQQAPEGLDRKNRNKSGVGSGLNCPTCGAIMPRCGLCMVALGSPDPAKVGGAAALEDEDVQAKRIVFCSRCGHGFHGHHARDWFAKHAMCPVPDCQCMCGLLR